MLGRRPAVVKDRPTGLLSILKHLRADQSPPDTAIDLVRLEVFKGNMPMQGDSLLIQLFRVMHDRGHFDDSVIGLLRASSMISKRANVLGILHSTTNNLDEIVAMHGSGSVSAA
jgi:hypothetical protein